MKKRDDFIGTKNGMLKALERAPKAVHLKARSKLKYYWFLCDCGNKIIASKVAVLKGNRSSCGCKTRRKRPDDTSFAGVEIGFLTAVKKIKQGTANRNSYWLFRCRCGKEVSYMKRYVAEHKNLSCGCNKNIVWPVGKQSRYFKGHEEISSSFWSRVKKGAQVRRIEFDLNIEDAWQKFLDQDKKCALSGVELYFDSRTKRCDGNLSFDRIDSSKGYFIDNVQWVEKRINVMKNSLPEVEFIHLCKLIAEKRG